MLGSKCKSKNISFYRSLSKEQKKTYNRNPIKFMEVYLNLSKEEKVIKELERKIKRLQNKINTQDTEISRLKSRLNSTI